MPSKNWRWAPTFALLSVSHTRIGIFDLQSKNLPEVVYTSFRSRAANSFRGDGLEYCTVPTVPLHEMLNGFEHLSISLNEKTKMLVLDAISSIQPTADGEVRHAMQQPISALNGVIYSINESFLGPGCGIGAGMEVSNEDGKQPRIKRREKQTKGGENVFALD